MIWSRWLTLQAWAFRGHDESPGSINRGNFLKDVKLLVRLDIFSWCVAFMVNFLFSPPYGQILDPPLHEGFPL